MTSPTARERLDAVAQRYGYERFVQLAADDVLTARSVAAIAVIEAEAAARADEREVLEEIRDRLDWKDGAGPTLEDVTAIVERAFTIRARGAA